MSTESELTLHRLNYEKSSFLKIRIDRKRRELRKKKKLNKRGE